MGLMLRLASPDVFVCENRVVVVSAPTASGRPARCWSAPAASPAPAMSRADRRIEEELVLEDLLDDLSA
ncbi:hypothetical protein ACWGE0_11615 [Lentzea sp. NPDC054927]